MCNSVRNNNGFVGSVLNNNILINIWRFVKDPVECYFHDRLPILKTKIWNEIDENTTFKKNSVIIPLSNNNRIHPSHRIGLVVGLYEKVWIKSLCDNMGDDMVKASGIMKVTKKKYSSTTLCVVMTCLLAM